MSQITVNRWVPIQREAENTGRLFYRKKAILEERNQSLGYFTVYTSCDGWQKLCGALQIMQIMQEQKGSCIICIICLLLFVGVL